MSKPCPTLEAKRAEWNRDRLQSAGILRDDIRRHIRFSIEDMSACDGADNIKRVGSIDTGIGMFCCVSYACGPQMFRDILLEETKKQMENGWHFLIAEDDPGDALYVAPYPMKVKRRWYWFVSDVIRADDEQ